MYLDLFLRPLVQIDRLDLGDVDPEVPVDAGTADADEDAQVPRGPSRTCRHESGRRVVSDNTGGA